MKVECQFNLRSCCAMRLCLLSLPLLTLSACGGGGGGGGDETSSSSPNSATSFVETIEETQEQPSTALADNPTSNTASFDNYQNVFFEIDLSDYPMEGERRFLKIYTNNEVLFLGEINLTGIFELPLRPKQSDSLLYFDLFSESVLDQTISSEVRL